MESQLQVCHTTPEMYSLQHRSKIDLFSAKREKKMLGSCLALAMVACMLAKKVKKASKWLESFQGLSLGAHNLESFLIPSGVKKARG